MNKNILLFSATMISICMAAYGFMNNTHSGSCQKIVTCSKPSVLNKLFLEDMGSKPSTEFFYSVGTRFSGIKKTKLNKIRSVADFLRNDHVDRIVSYRSTQITILDDSNETDNFELGDNNALTQAQINLLQSADYSTNILIRADYTQKNQATGEVEDAYSTPHLTIVPEKEAQYLNGKVAFLNYLKVNSQDIIAIAQKDKLEPGKLYFTVDTYGTISEVLLKTTSGYPSIDKTMIDLISNPPGKWKPAENMEGKKVNQTLVFSFGIIGC